MLTFNLGIFFRNLHGQSLVFSARREGADVHFVGGVRSLQEKTGLVRHLSLTLGQEDLSIHITFDEGEEAEREDNPDVLVTLMREGQAQPLFQAVFAFEEIRLQPLAAEGEADAISADSSG